MSSKQIGLLIKPLFEKTIQTKTKHLKQNKPRKILKKSKHQSRDSKEKNQIRMKRDHATETAKSVSKYYSLRKKRSENFYDRIDENAKIFHGDTIVFEIPKDRRFAARLYETIDIHSAIEKLKNQKRIVRIIDHPDGNATRLLRQKKWEYPLDKNLKPGIHIYDFRNGQDEPYYTYIPSQNKEDYNDIEDEILNKNERDDKRNKNSQNDNNDDSDNSNTFESGGDDDDDEIEEEEEGEDSDSGLDILSNKKIKK